MFAYLKTNSQVLKEQEGFIGLYGFNNLYSKVKLLIRNSIVLLFLTVCYSLMGNEPELIFKYQELALSDHGVRAIIEDYKGFMWFGAESGLNRYDGVNMRIYTKVSDDSTLLTNNSILTLCETKSKELWIGTHSGLNLYNRKQDNFIQYYYDKSDGKGQDFNFIHKVIEDTDGEIWAATIGGVCLVDKGKGELVEFGDYFHDKQCLNNRAVNSLIEDVKGRILACSEDGEILYFNKIEGTVTEFVFDNGNSEGTRPIIATNIAQTYDSILWATTTTGSLIRIDSLANGHIWHEQFIPDPLNEDSQSHLYVSGICEYDTNVILFSTENSGLSMFNYKTKTFKRYLKEQNTNGNSIGGNSIWTLYKDSYDRIWLGIFNVGINIIDNTPQKFKSYKHNSSNTKSLTHGAITSFVEDYKGNMWLTSDGGGLDYWDREHDVFTHYRYNPENRNGLLSDAGLCLHYTQQGELWAGFYTGGIHIIRKDKTFKNLTINEGLSSNSIFSIVERNNGKIYIATYSGGLDVYDPETKVFKTYFNESFEYSDLRNIQINLLFVDSKDRLWLGLNNNGGLFLMLEDENGNVSFKGYRNEPGDSNSISDNTILTISESSDGTLWVGTRDGLNKLTNDNTFTVFRTTDGLPSNTIVGILEDDAGMLWISSLNGLSMFNPLTEVFKNYNKDDGLQGQKFSNRTAVYKNSNGELFFGGNNGFTVFNPSKIRYDRRFQNVYLIDFKIFNQRVAIGKNNSPLKNHITETEELILNHKQSVFSLEYVALNFTSQKKIQYAYKLEGIEEHWNYVGQKRTATYTNLDPGKYVFRVKSTNSEGDWNLQETKLRIIVKPPWWETWWTKSISILMLLGFLYMGYIMKVRSIKKQKDILQKTVWDRTTELYEKNTELEEINEEVTQQKEELLSQAEVLADTNHKLEQSAEQLSKHKNNLEHLVAERTSELEKSKEHAEESDRLKSAFLANMSHEIRTPLNAIVGFSHLLDDPDITKDEQSEYILNIDTNTESLLKLIDDILDLSLIESNQMSIELTEINVGELLDEVFTSGTIVNKKIDIRLNKVEGANTIRIKSDRFRIKQILLNLFNNACKFTEQGYVELGCRLDKENIVFFIKDTGIGISKENMGVVFNRFRTISNEKTKLFRGAGLGLAISKKIADILEGELSVESELGKGSLFSFTLPVFNISEQKKRTDKKDLLKPNYDWKHKSVLIVEDEKANYDYLFNVLKGSKIKIVRAENGAQAVELFKNNARFDIVLMDIKMPVMNGFDATLAIKKIVPEQLIIAQTAFARPKDISELQRAGFEHYLVKPIIPKDLLDILQRNI